MLVIISCTFFKDNFDIFYVYVSVLLLMFLMYIFGSVSLTARTRVTLGIGAGREIMEKQFPFKLSRDITEITPLWELLPSNLS